MHRYIHKILAILVSKSFYTSYVKLPPVETPEEIRNNPKLFPYFEKCLGAVDGSHIDAHVPAELAPRYRNRKGRLSINLLAACSFDMKFVYLLSGWEGSACDGLVFVVKKSIIDPSASDRTTLLDIQYL